MHVQRILVLEAMIIDDVYSFLKDFTSKYPNETS